MDALFLVVLLFFFPFSFLFFFKIRVTFIDIIHYKSRVESRAACLQFGLTRETV